MVLDRFFKPKWQHKKAQVRLQAVAQLDPKNKEHLNVLRTLAIGDNEPSVQKTAVQRINQIHPLEEMLKTHPDKQLENWLTHQIAHLLAHKHAKELDETEQVQYIQKCSHQQIIQYVALNAELSTLQLAAIKRLEDESDLSQVVINASASNLRFAAAERIHSKQALSEIVKLIRNKDKKVTRLIRDKLSELEQAQNHENELQQALKDNVEAIEKLAQNTDSIQFESRLKNIEQKWKHFSETTTAPYLSRYQSAHQQCQAIAERHQQQKVAQQNQAVALENATEELTSTCDILENCLEGLEVQIKQNEFDEPALNAVITSQGTRWEEACQHARPSPEVKQRYQNSNALLNQLLAANQRLKERDQDLQALLQTDPQNDPKPRNTQRSIEKLQQYISWPHSFQSHPALENLAEMSQHLHTLEKTQRQKIEQRIKKLDSNLEQIKSAIHQGSLKTARKLSKEVRKELSDLPHQKTKTISREFQALQSTMDELTDWQGFATTPKKEQLIEKMQQLVNAELDLEDKADQIRNLQGEWKQLGASDPKVSKSQWDRFKTAADSAYEPCKAYFQDKNAQRGANLSKRIALCEQLEVYIEGSDWNQVDWKKVEEIHQVARKEWQLYSPVDRSAGKDTQQRFNLLLKEIQNRINEEKNQNAEQKDKLIAEAKLLLEEADLNKAIEAIKSLQGDWKKIGVTQHQKGRQQWKEFREHCDAIFARRDQQRHDKIADQQSQAQQADEICQTLETLIQKDYGEIIAGQKSLNQFRAQLDSLTNIPGNQRKGIDKRFNRLNEEFALALTTAKQQQLLASLNTARQAAELCQQIERLLEPQNDASSQGQKSEAISETALEAVLETALETKLATIVAGWPQEFENIDRQWQSAINARFEHAKESAANLIADGTNRPSKSQQELDTAMDQLENLCIGMEILSNVESPVEAQSKRMAYQVNRLASGLGQSKQHQTDQQQMIDLELNWLQQPWINTVGHPDLQQRYERALQAFYSESNAL